MIHANTPRDDEHADHDAHDLERSEAAWEAAHTHNPGPLEQAIDAGYDPADWQED